MLNPKKTIPKLTVAMLALTGCGDDNGNGNGGNGGAAGAGGEGGPPGGTSFEVALNAFCDNAAPCFNAPTQGCVYYYNAVNEYNSDAQCEAALISYFNCGATKGCNELLQGACDDEYYAVWGDAMTEAACDEIPLQ